MTTSEELHEWYLEVREYHGEPVIVFHGRPGDLGRVDSTRVATVKHALQTRLHSRLFVDAHGVHVKLVGSSLESASEAAGTPRPFINSFRDGIPPAWQMLLSTFIPAADQVDSSPPSPARRRDLGEGPSNSSPLAKKSSAEEVFDSPKRLSPSELSALRRSSSTSPSKTAERTSKTTKRKGRASKARTEPPTDSPTEAPLLVDQAEPRSCIVAEGHEPPDSSPKSALHALQHKMRPAQSPRTTPIKSLQSISSSPAGSQSDDYDQLADEIVDFVIADTSGMGTVLSPVAQAIFERTSPLARTGHSLSVAPPSPLQFRMQIDVKAAPHEAVRAAAVVSPTPAVVGPASSEVALAREQHPADTEDSAPQSAAIQTGRTEEEVLFRPADVVGSCQPDSKATSTAPISRSSSALTDIDTPGPLSAAADSPLTPFDTDTDSGADDEADEDESASGSGDLEDSSGAQSPSAKGDTVATVLSPQLERESEPITSRQCAIVISRTDTPATPLHLALEARESVSDRDVSSPLSSPAHAPFVLIDSSQRARSLTPSSSSAQEGEKIGASGTSDSDSESDEETLASVAASRGPFSIMPAARPVPRVARQSSSADMTPSSSINHFSVDLQQTPDPDTRQPTPEEVALEDMPAPSMSAHVIDPVDAVVTIEKAGDAVLAVEANAIENPCEDRLERQLIEPIAAVPMDPENLSQPPVNEVPQVRSDVVDAEEALPMLTVEAILEHTSDSDPVATVAALGTDASVEDEPPLGVASSNASEGSSSVPILLPCEAESARAPLIEAAPEGDALRRHSPVAPAGLRTPSPSSLDEPITPKMRPSQARRALRIADSPEPPFFADGLIDNAVADVGTDAAPLTPVEKTVVFRKRSPSPASASEERVPGDDRSAHVDQPAFKAPSLPASQVHLARNSSGKGKAPRAAQRMSASSQRFEQPDDQSDDDLDLITNVARPARRCPSLQPFLPPLPSLNQTTSSSSNKMRERAEESPDKPTLKKASSKGSLTKIFASTTKAFAAPFHKASKRRRFNTSDLDDEGGRAAAADNDAYDHHDRQKRRRVSATPDSARPQRARKSTSNWWDLSVALERVEETKRKPYARLEAVAADSTPRRSGSVASTVRSARA